jgi:hypothetical protein
VEHYKTYVPEDSENAMGHKKFEVTLLINCLVDLLVLPTQDDLIPKQYRKITLDKLNGWGLNKDHIKATGKYDELKLENVVTKLRNSVSHVRFEDATNTGTKITHLRFTDQDGFEAIIPVECLESFVMKLAKSALQVLEEREEKRKKRSRQK